MNNSKISWTDDTNNPIIVEGGGFYCAKVSAGCTNCYAEVVNKRICGYQGVVPYDFKAMKNPPKMELKRGMIQGWKHKKKSRKIFVSSMTDVFGEFVPDEFIFEILDGMVAAPKQIFQVLTKRSSRMKEMVHNYCEMRGIDMLPQHIWLIVSVENQDVIHRAIDLVATRCVVRGLSIEPMIGRINLSEAMALQKWVHWAPPKWEGGTIHNVLDTRIIEHIDWVIVGGESGTKARMMNPAWVRGLLDQCRKYNVPFFFKQWGEWVAGSMNRVNGRILLQDGSRLMGHTAYSIHKWDDRFDVLDNVVSVRVGKKERDLLRSGDEIVTSDNALFDGKHYHEFPKYLTQ